MGTMIRAMISIGLLALFGWLFKVDFQLLLILSIAYDLTYLRIQREEDGTKDR